MIEDIKPKSRVSVMLDPSFLDPLQEGRAEDIIRLGEANVNVYVAGSFYRAAKEGSLSLDTAARLYGDPRWRLDERERWPGRRRDTYRDQRRKHEARLSDLADWLQRLQVQRFSPEQALTPDVAGSVRLELTIKDELVRRITEEEWLFLQTQSLLGSKIRRPFSEFVRAGAVAVEAGRRTLLKLEQRTLKLPPDTQKELDAIQHLRVGVKWIGAGGAALGLLNPLLGVAAGVAYGWFILLDP